MQTTGTLDKMRTSFINPVQYFLPLGAAEVAMNELLHHDLTLRYTGNIYCTLCNKKTRKSFGEGLCYNCFENAPENAECIIRPELCQAHLHRGRDVEWELRHHLQPHYVYLAMTNEVKVGVTRDTQIPTRWIDQGAGSAILIAQTPYRQLAGAIEVALKQYFTDKTQWNKMLTNAPCEKNLLTEKQRIRELLPDELRPYVLPDDEVVQIQYPVQYYPGKVKSLSLDKEPLVKNRLHGIRGQYLIFQDGQVLNIRKHSGYEVELSC